MPHEQSAITTQETNTPSSDTAVDEIPSQVSNVTVQEDGGDLDPDDSSDKTKNAHHPRTLPPDGMPPLKEWFGTDNEQGVTKKDSDIPSPPTSTRDRRFRRDPEDGEAPTRPSFRGTLSQPSQMGNFKHQPIRANDRDRDRDADRDREIRDKENQERLRNLSDAYDRDRLAHPSNITKLRNKERDVAPHLQATSSSRVGSQNQSAVAARRVDARESLKKKAGEASEDWRRGPESVRSAREERSDNARRDREDRDRPRSRIREQSRSKRDSSTSRRDRDDRERKVDRDRDDFSRRDRDVDRDLEGDDPRRWRDDGRRDERMAARRDRPRGAQESGWDSSFDRQADRRWIATEERDSRAKRSTGRERKTGAAGDEGKERDDRKDRERERDREKEKQPAWMDTYIPSGPSNGILGGKGAEGELDGIQAWKKEQKEKEQKETATQSNDDDHSQDSRTVDSMVLQAVPPEKQLDEIQLFRLMMKREEEKKKTDQSPIEPTGGSPLPRADSVNQLSTALSEGMNISSMKEPIILPMTSQTGIIADVCPDTEKHPSSAQTPQPLLSSQGTSPASRPIDVTTDPVPDGSRNLLSILSHSASTPNMTDANVRSRASPSAIGTDPALDRTKPPGSRLFPHPLSSDIHAPQAAARSSFDQLTYISQNSTQFNPPPGSRLLAFGTRPPSNTGVPPGLSNQSRHSASATGPPAVTGFSSAVPNTLQNGNMQIQSGYDISSSHRPVVSESTPVNHQSFSPFDEQRESRLSGNADGFRRGLMAPHGERASLSLQEQIFADMGGNGFQPNNQGVSFDASHGVGPGLAAAKGSRFAKFFDGKAREGQGAVLNKQSVSGLVSSSPIPAQRQEPNNFNGMMNNNSDARTMEELFAMLNNSSQGQRLNVMHQAGASNIGSFGQMPNNMQTSQGQSFHQQQHLPAHSRVDSLYESRLDERSFVPNEMVPGLRSVPQPRNRENSGMFADQLDDVMQFNNQRIPPQQQRVLDQLYSGSAALYGQQQQQPNIGRNAVLQPQSQFRGGPSPNPLAGPAQRLPPGLANLGGRPPHEPSQFMAPPMGVPSGGLHAPQLHPSRAAQQPYNNFAANGLGFAGGPQMRIPHPGNHQMQNSMGHNSMAGLGHPGNIDLRGPAQNQLLGLGAGVGMSGGLRGTGVYNQQTANSQMQGPPLHALRQQPQLPQQLPPHMLGNHMVSQNIQQQGIPGQHNQPAQDLMALLMGGAHRE